MQIKAWIRRYALWGLATIFLGAIGSGTWDYILKPSLSGASHACLSVATLGIHRFSDGIFTEIAQGHHEGASTSLLVMAYAMFIGLAFGLRAMAKRQDRGETKRSYPPTIFLTLLCIFMLALYLQFFVRTACINFGIQNFNQMLAITSPFMSEHERAVFTSRFAQVQSGDDYFSVMRDLKAIARKNKLRIPNTP